MFPTFGFHLNTVGRKTGKTLNNQCTNFRRLIFPMLAFFNYSNDLSGGGKHFSSTVLLDFFSFVSHRI